MLSIRRVEPRKRSSCDANRAMDRSHWLERSRVDNLEIVQPEQRLSVENPPSYSYHLPSVLLAGLHRVPERAVARGRSPELTPRSARLSRTLRELSARAVRFPHRFHARDLDRQAGVFRRAASLWASCW